MILCTKCTNERIVDQEIEPIIKSGQVSLKVFIPKGSVSTYANEDASALENRIDSLYVDLYENNGLLKESQFHRSELKIALNTNDSIVEIGYEVDNIIDGKLFARVYANRKSVKTITGEIYPDATDRETLFFMSGSDSIRSNGTSYEGTIHLVRDVAKVRVNISKHLLILPKDLEIDYDNVKIQALNVPNQTSLFPGADVAKGQSTFGYINYPERSGLPPLPSSLRPSPTFNNTAGGQIDSFYVNENHLSTYSTGDITKVRVTIPTYSPTDGAKVASYDYDLFTVTSRNALLRNYIYTLDIKVRGQSLEPVITIDVQPWKDVNGDGNIYGTYLTVSPEIKFDSNGEAIIDFCTDAQALYFNFEDFTTNTGAEINGMEIFTEGIDTDNKALNPTGFKDGKILLDQQHCGNFKFKLDLSEDEFSKFPEFNVSGEISMKAGNIVRYLMLPAQRICDAHFIVGDSIFNFSEEYTQASVYEDGKDNITPGWLNISTSRLYTSTGMLTSYNGMSTKLYLHLDENLTGYSRTGSVTVTTSGGVKRKLCITQLPAIPVGRFGYTNVTPADDSIYTAMLYTEQRYEFTTMPTYIGTGSPVTFSNAIYNGRLSAKSAFDWSKYNNAVTPFDYQNTLYQAINYCAHKNRITGSGSVDGELKWYLPSQAQLLGMWLSYNFLKDIGTSNFRRIGIDSIFWSSTANKLYTDEAQLINFKFGNVGHHYKSDKNWARCVRDVAGGSSMILPGSYPVIDFENGMPTASYTIISKNDGAGNENSYNNNTLFKTLRVAVNDLSTSGAPWSITACNSYAEGGVTGWRLPTQRELQSIWILQNEIKKTFTGFNLLREDYYWSATESSAADTHAWTIFGSGSRADAGGSGNAPIQHKSQQFRIRCVREF
jgi:hypothetical protein